MAKYRNLEPNEAFDLLKDKNVQIIDVRTPHEFMQGALPNAQLFPIQLLPKKLQDLPQEKDVPMLVYCAHGIRSLRAVEYLAEQGYSNLYHLHGGLAAYQEQYKV